MNTRAVKMRRLLPLKGRNHSSLLIRQLALFMLTFGLILLRKKRPQTPFGATVGGTSRVLES